MAFGAGLGEVFEGSPIQNAPETCPERPGAKYARICLIVLRVIVGQLPNDVVSEVLWLLYGHSIWHAYPSVPPSLCRS